jgi:flavin-dependent dehydrogenase
MTLARDVVVLGGGPAGLATAIALARRGRSVVVLERTKYDKPRAGETFGGDLRPLLEEIGVDDFGSIDPVPFRGVQSAWGGAELAERASIFHPFGDGWHVDRARFDRLLARTAERAGVAVMQGAGACELERAEGGWRVRPQAGAEVRARWLVDASGRGAPASAVDLTERRWMRADRLVALIGVLEPQAAPAEPVLLLEAVEEGWWYSVPQPGGALLLSLMTDADLLPARGRAALAQHFSAALSRTVLTSARAGGAALSAAPWIARADSGLLLPDRGPGWRAVGDAAMACDPLAGDGVVRALRAAREAAPEIDRALDSPEAGSEADAGQGLSLARFRDYLEMRGRYYAHEPRWPSSPFWARRRSIDWQGAPLFLDPRQLLRLAEVQPGPAALAPIEALLPPHAVRALLARMKTPCLAHEALALLRSTAPLDDRRLLVGLQYLVHTGCVLAA